MQQLKSDSCIVAVVFVRQNGMAWSRDLHTFSLTKRGVVSILIYFLVDWSLYITNWTGSLEHEAHGAAVWKSSCEDLADFFSLLGHCDTNQRHLSASCMGFTKNVKACFPSYCCNTAVQLWSLLFMCGKALGCQGLYHNMGSSSAPCYVGPYSGKAFGLGVYLPQTA